MLEDTDTQTELKYVELSSIVESPVAIRSAQKESEDYVGLLESIKQHGVLQPILLRRLPNSDDGSSRYGLINGLQRYTASLDAGLTKIPALIKDATEADTLVDQILTNLHVIETKPVEYTRGLVRLLAQDPDLTLTGLAAMLGKTTQWLDSRLSLTQLNPNVAALVNEGLITLPNAYILAKLPPDEQDTFSSDAQNEAAATFVPKIQKRVKEIKEAARKGKSSSESVYEPHARYRKLSDAKSELDIAEAGPRLCAANGAVTPTDGFRLGVAWVTQLDPQTISIEKSKFEADQAAKAEAKAKRDAEKKEKAIKSIEEKQAELDKDLAELALK